MLVNVDAAPTVSVPNGSIVLTYTIFSPSAQQISLGAAVHVNGSGGGSIDDPPHNRTLSIPAGSSVVTRTFTLPDVSDVSYDMIWAVWNVGFTTEYDLKTRLNIISVKWSNTHTISTHSAGNRHWTGPCC